MYFIWFLEQSTLVTTVDQYKRVDISTHSASHKWSCRSMFFNFPNISYFSSCYFAIPYTKSSGNTRPRIDFFSVTHRLLHMAGQNWAFWVQAYEGVYA